MKCTNNQILTWHESLEKLFKNSKDIYFPAKVGFCLAKNKKILSECVNEIMNARDNLAIHYGEAQEDGNYFIPEEHRMTIQKELMNLYNIEQDINFMLISINDLTELGNLPLEYWDGLCFMLKEE